MVTKEIKCTKSDKLPPIPESNLTLHSVLAMPLRHLTGLPSELVQVWPHIFSSLPMEMSNVRHICVTINILTELFVIAYMTSRDYADHSSYHVKEVRVVGSPAP